MTAGSPGDATNNDDEFISLLALLSSAAPDASAVTAQVHSLEDKMDGPCGVIRALLPRLWLPANDGSKPIQGDGALSILIYLVESRPSEYMAHVASNVRREIEHNFVKDETNALAAASFGERPTVPNGLVLALAKLMVGPNSDDQVGIATDSSASLLAICRWDRDQNHTSSIANIVLSTIDMIWDHLLQQGNEQKRQSSTSLIRIASLMIDICLLGGDEMLLALSDDNAAHSIMDKLLRIALEYPNDDPLLQVSALDQLERLALDDGEQSQVKADFLLANDIIRRGLLCLVGSPGNLLRDADDDDKQWGEPDPINGGAALRLLTEICRIGVAQTCKGKFSIRESTLQKFELLISGFSKALHNFDPKGELERLSFIYAVSSLVSSCAMVASESPEAGIANGILADKTLLNEWLSLHTRVSQPKLKSTVLSSLSQVFEPVMWKSTNSGLNNATRPSDSIVLQLYQAFGQANNERDSTELILASAKSPFLEERLGAYSILRALVMRGVGVRLLLLYGDGGVEGSDDNFLEWLLRGLESTSEGKKAKYLIVDSMLSQNSNLIAGLLPAKVLRQLSEWRRTGPNFTSTMPLEMATE